MSKRKIRVLIVDDSAVVRQTLSELLSADPDIEVIATAPDPFVAADRISEQVPDVITLDIEMPHMDGLTFLQKIMSQHPIPVVICSSLAEEGAQSALKALEYGAVEIIAKPRLGSKQFLEESREMICDAVKAAASAHVRVYRPSRVVEPKLTADAILSPASHAMAETTEKVVAIGASTGGTEALKVLLEALPADAPGIVIVQHMPELFTRAFANRLDGLCKITVKEAESNDTVLRGCALIAAGNHHLLPQTKRRSILRGDEGRAAGVPSPSVSGRAVSLYCALRREKRRRRNSDRNGRRRRQRNAGNEASGRGNHRSR